MSNSTIGMWIFRPKAKILMEKGGRTMDPKKIGGFIAQRRKQMNLTQAQLAEKLNITDRAVSKWETGRAMPDTAIMPELCQILAISINDLFQGEVVCMDHYKEKTEQTLLELAKQKEQADKQLLRMEIVSGIVVILLFVALDVLVGVLPMEDWLRVVIIVGSLLLVLIWSYFALKIEQTAGYYACPACGHRYVPTFGSVLWAPHMGRTRNMRCPHCGKRTWQKKVLTKE